MTGLVLPAWGSSPFGVGPFGGELPSSFGGHIPASAPFDVYNVTPGSDMAAFASYLEVEILAVSAQVGSDLATGDFQLTSGGLRPNTNARALINMPVPDVFTFEATVKFESLPANFTDLTTYSNSAAAIRNDIYQLARKVKIIGDALRTYGLLS